MKKGIYAIFYKDQKSPYVFCDMEKGTQKEARFIHREEAERIAYKMGKDFSVRIYF